MSEKFHLSWQKVWLPAVFVASVAFAAPVHAQTTDDLSNRRQEDLVLTQILKLPRGTIVAEGGNTNLGGSSGVTSYQVERLQLSQPVKTEIRGEMVEVEQAYRVTLRGGPFRVRALPPSLYLDGEFASYGVERPDLKAITFIVFDRSLLREGVALAFAYGKAGVGRVEMSDKLNLRNNR